MAENVGAIYYTVEADTQKLLDSVQPTNASLSKLEKTFARTDKAANDTTFTMTKTAAAVKGLGAEAGGASDAMSGLTKILKGYLTLQGVNSLIQMAEGYNEMAERVRMASSSVAEYEMVQQRLLATANGTYRAMSEAQEVYILTADALRSMGYQTSDVLDITDSLSYALVKNAASGQRAQSAISAYAKSIQVGKVQADAWQSILAATPSIVSDIAAAAGLTAEEVRKLGAEGKLTAQQLNEGLRQSLDSNKAAADGMATTVRDAFTAMRNNLAAYVGEANQASGATGVLSSAILGLGENIDVIVKTLMAAGAGAMALYIARTGQAAIASAKAMLAARAEAAENLRLAQARVVATQAALAHAQANAGLTGSFASLTAAENANTAATAALSAAQRIAASAGATLLGVLGGPVGIIGMVATAAAGWALFRERTDGASKSLLDIGQPLEERIKQFKELNNAQREGELIQAAKLHKQAVQEADAAFGELLASMHSVNGFRNDYSVQQWIGFRAAVVAAREAGEDLTPIIKKAAEESGINSNVIDSWLTQSANVSTLERRAGTLRGELSALRAEEDRLAAATNNAAEAQRNQNAAFNDAQTDDYLKRLRERREAIEDEGSAVKEAERYISKLTDVSAERIAQIREEAAAVDRGNAAKKAKTAATKAETDAERKAKQAAEELKRSQESNVQTIDKMAQSLRFAALSGEALAKAQAAASLNSVATPEQVAQIEAMAAALYKVQQAEEARKKVGGTAQEVEKYIFGDVQPLSGGAFDDQTERYDAEAKAEQKRYEEQLKRLQEAKAAEVQQRQAYATMIEELQTAHLDRMAALETEKEQAKTEVDAQKLESDIALEQTKYEDELARLQEHLEKKYQLQVDYGALEQKLAEENAARQAQIEKAKSQVLLSSASDAFGSLADVMKSSAGEQSGIYKAMFAASKAFAIAESIVKIQQGIASAAALPFPANIPAMATVAAQTASIVSTISGTSYGSGRQYGGPVSPGKGYRINENGAPEILNTASGRQYLLPNSRGEVVSNKEATGGSGAAPINVTVQLIEDASRGGQVEQSYINEQYVLNICVASIRRGTDLAQAVEGTYGIGRRGR